MFSLNLILNKNGKFNAFELNPNSSKHYRNEIGKVDLNVLDVNNILANYKCS